ncbi:CU044_2847 family protein [Actinokineospora sp. NBRC 105648]|uniref:CU044_2847 family protein n=1 Tax=Actinokineospora sp. NBRC 105648 TaxID=3032206 RepID=UPI0024A09635|nr:CU044_2847 family protein [Actinokineospora sp. NBRC 105648]GLZ40691.1 hypothetical protein Acsp05_43150 [Actinokineospora sp. NBRC 105648]
MAVEIARFPLADGGSVLVEVDEVPGVARASRPGKVMTEARTVFENAVGQVRDAAAAALTQFSSMTRAPDEVELKFGMKLDVEAGAVIARTGVQGQFEVKLKWRRADDLPVDEVTVEES